MGEKFKYGEGDERKLKPTSFFIRRLAEPHPADPQRRLYETDLSIIQKVIGQMPTLSPDKLKGTINLARYNFASRILLPESLSKETATQHQQDMDYIRNLYPSKTLSDMDILQMLERPDGTKTNLALIRSRMKPQPDSPPPPQDAVTNATHGKAHSVEPYDMVAFWKNWKDVEATRGVNPYMGERTSEVKAPSDIDKPLSDHNSVIFVDRT